MAQVGTFRFLNGDNKVCTVPILSPSTSPFRMQGSTGTGGIDLVSVTDPKAGAYRVQTAGGVKAVALDVAFCQHFDGTSMPYTTQATTVQAYQNSVCNLLSTTWDAYIDMPSLGSFDPNKYRYLDIRYRMMGGTTAGGTVQIYFYNAVYGSANEANNYSSAYTSQLTDSTWRIFTMDMWNHANWKNSNVTGWRFDWTNVSGASMEFDYIRLRT